MDLKQVITRQQYLEALALVDMYHRQSTNTSFRNAGKTGITDWINSIDSKPSARLHRLLLSFDYFEDVNKLSFLDKRNAGPGAWEEFCSLANIEP